jgi:glutamine synthetase
MSVATAANDHRLGKAEAPPAIISMFLGDELTEIIDSIQSGGTAESRDRIKMDIGVDTLPKFPKDTTDRNRTSPFAFTGNKFEFRMVGSSLSIAGPLFVLNTIVADVLEEFADRLEKAGDLTAELNAIVKETLTEHDRIIFNGDGYSPEWLIEAKKRGLLNLLTAVDALPYFTTPENIALFEKHGVLSPGETISRTELLLESYVKILNIEALSMLELAHRAIVPAVITYSGEVAKSADATKKLSSTISTKIEEKLLEKIAGLSDKLVDDIESLEKANAGADADLDALGLATYYKDTVIPAMNKLRETVDTLEQIVDQDYWPLPSYGDILYRVK